VQIPLSTAPTEGEDTVLTLVMTKFRIFSASSFGGGLVAGDCPKLADSPETGTFVSSADPTPRGSSAQLPLQHSTGLLQLDQDGTLVRIQHWH